MTQDQTNKSKCFTMMQETLILSIKKLVRFDKDEQERIQTKTFTKWMNSYLYQLKPPIVVKDLMSEIKTGIILLKLLEILTKKEFKKDEPKNMQRIHCLTNVKRALDYMEQECKIKLVNINASDVVDGKPSIVLGLMWTSILHFQIEEQEEYLLAALGLENDPNAKVKGKAKQTLMAWTNKALNDKYGLNIKDFGPSWRDGKAFNALVHNINPDLINMIELESKSNQDRLENAFNLAEFKLGIPKLLDAEDVDVAKPDEKSIMTYVAQFLKSSEDMKPTDPIEEEINETMVNDEMSALPIDDAELVKQFIKKVDDTSENPDTKSDYDIFDDLMQEKEETKNKLNNLPEKNEQLQSDFKNHEEKLKQWKDELDRNIADKDGAEVGNWVVDMEKFLDEKMPDPNDPDYKKKLDEKVLKLQKLSNGSESVQKKLTELLKNPPNKVPVKQLEDLKKRLDQLVDQKPLKEDELKLLETNEEIQKEKEKLNKNLEEWNKPIESFEELEKILNDFNSYSENGSPMDQFSGLLDNLVEMKNTVNNQNPVFNKVYGKYLDSSINEYQDDNEYLPEKFDETRSMLENLSSSWMEVKDDEKKIEMFINKLNKALESDDMDKQRSLLNNIPQMQEMLQELNHKVDEQLKPYCATKATQNLYSNIQKLSDALDKKQEDLVNKIKEKEQAIEVQKQEAARKVENEELKKNQDVQLKEVQDWMNKLEKSLNTQQVSPQQIPDTIKKLEEDKKAGDQISKQFPKIEEAIKYLKNNGEPEKAKELEDNYKKMQKQFNHLNNEIIPHKIETLQQIDKMCHDIEQGLEDLNNYTEEGDSIRNCLTKSANIDDTRAILQSEKDFCDKKDEILNSIEKDKELLKNLEKISEDSTIKVDIEPLRTKIAASEKNLEQLLDFAQNNLEANLSCQSACNQAMEQLNAFQKCIDDTNIDESAPHKDNDEVQKDKLNKLENYEKKLAEVEELIEKAQVQKNNSKPYLSQAEQEKLDKEIEKMENTANNLRDKIDDDKLKTRANLDNWGQFKHLQNDLEQCIEENKIEKEKNKDTIDSKNVQSKKHGYDEVILGGSLNDKINLLDSTKKKLSELERRKADIKSLNKLSAKIDSPDAIKMAADLSNAYDEQIQQLQKQVETSEKSVEDHEKYHEKLSDFDNWFMEAQKISNKLHNLPNDKDSLAEKQRLLEKLATLKPEAERKLAEIKDQSNLLKEETSKQSHKEIDQDYTKELNKFDSIFQSIDNENDNIASTLSAVKTIENDYLDLADEIDSLVRQLERCETTTPDTIEGKQKLDRDLQDMISGMKENRKLVDKLKQKCNELPNETIAQEMLLKINELERKDKDIVSEIDDMMMKNNRDIEQYNNLEEDANKMEELLYEIENQLENCSNTQSPDSLDKIKEIKAKLPECKAQLEKIIEKRSNYHVPSKLDDLCDKIEESYCNLEDKINETERDLGLKKEAWQEFNDDKDNLEKWINNIHEKMDKLHEENQGVHAGSCADKEALLNTTRDLLQSVINRETDIQEFLKKSSNVKFNSPENSPKKASANLCKKYEKLTEELMKSVQIAEDDLKLHKAYDEELQKFKKSTELELNKLNSELTSLPNSKDGLERKKEIFNRITQLEQSAKEKMENLEEMKNQTSDHSAPKVAQLIDNQWSDLKKSFDRNFSSIKENEQKFKSKLGNIQKSENEYSDLLEKLEQLETKQGEIMSEPVQNLDELTEKLDQIRQIDDEMSAITKQIDLFARSSSRNSSEFPDLKQKSDHLKDYGSSIKESIEKTLKNADNEHKKLSQLNASKENFSTWLKHTEKNLERFDKINEADYGQLKQKQHKLEILQDDIAEHKVYLSRLLNRRRSSAGSDSTLDDVGRIQLDPDSARQLEESYKILHDKCQNYAKIFDQTMRHLQEFETKRSALQNWMESNTQVLLKCSDYTMNPSQMRSKMMMIDNLEQELENAGRPKLAELEQAAEVLLFEGSNDDSMDFSVSKNVEQQLSEIRDEWETINKQMKRVGDQLRGNSARQDTHKSQINKINQWLGEMERNILTSNDSTVPIDHSCVFPNDSTDVDKAKQLLSELERQRTNIEQLSVISNELGTPAAQLENSQINSRYNKLYNHLQDKIEQDSKKEEEVVRMREEIEQMEKWVFQMSMKMIGDNNTNIDESESGIQDSPSHMLDQVNDNLKTIANKESQLSRIKHATSNVPANSDLAKQLTKLQTNFNSLKETAQNKKDHLMESTRKLDEHKKLLSIANNFLDNDFSQWKQWNDKTKNYPNGSFRFDDVENVDNIRLINDMEKKLNDVKKDIEKSAHDCDDVCLPSTPVASRTHTPSFRPNSRNALGPNQKSFDNQINPTYTQQTFSKIEDALKALSDAKKRTEDNQLQKKQYNNERECLKEAINGDFQKIAETLKSIPSSSDMDNFQKNTLNILKESLEHRKDQLKNLNDKYNQLKNNENDIITETDPGLREIQNKLKSEMNKIDRILNRQDKEVEADFPEEDDTISENIVPQLNLGTQASLKDTDLSDYEPTKENAAIQTLRSNMTQTSDMESEILFPGMKNGLKSGRLDKHQKMRELTDEIRGINRYLEQSKSFDSNRSPPYSSMTIPSTPLTLSNAPYYLNNGPPLESVRKNMIPNTSQVPCSHSHHEKLTSGPHSITFPASSASLSRYSTPRRSGQPSPKRIIDTPKQQPSIPLSHRATQSTEDYYVPTKNKWHEIDHFLNSSPQLHNMPQKILGNNNYSNYHPQNSSTNPREFEIDYSKPGKIPEDRQSSRKKPSKSSGTKSPSRNSSRVLEQLDKVDRDVKELKHLSNHLRNYRS